MHVFLSLSDFLVPSMTRPERTDTSVSHNALPTLRAGRTWHFTTRTTSNAERGCGDRERAAGCWTNARSESDTKRGGQLGRTAMRNKTRCDALPSVYRTLGCAYAKRNFPSASYTAFQKRVQYGTCHFSPRIWRNKWNVSLDTCRWTLKAILVTRFVLNVDIG